MHGTNGHFVTQKKKMFPKWKQRSGDIILFYFIRNKNGSSCRCR